jgi:hypothetical protein
MAALRNSGEMLRDTSSRNTADIPVPGRFKCGRMSAEASSRTTDALKSHRTSWCRRVSEVVV